MRLLVVDDEVRFATALQKGLELRGFAVDVAHDGQQALWLASEHPYDAIVLDIMLPVINGFVVCRRLREADNWTPVLMLTAKDGELDEAEALDTGADDFLSKPFSFVVLEARLRALLRRGVHARPTVLTVGDIVIDPASRSVRRGDVDIELTPKEFAILHQLAQHAGDVVSKSDLLAHAWDFAFEGDPNTVEVHVSNLRRKLDGPFGRQSVRTARGAGYRLVADDVD